MSQYRLKDSVVDAVQWDGTDFAAVQAMSPDAELIDGVVRINPDLTGVTDRQHETVVLHLHQYDWLIQYQNGLQSVMTNDQFVARFEPVVP